MDPVSNTTPAHVQNSSTLQSSYHPSPITDSQVSNTSLVTDKELGMITEVKYVKTESKVISLFIKYQFLILSSGLVVQSDYSISTYLIVRKTLLLYAHLS